MKIIRDEAEGSADALVALLRQPDPWIRNGDIVRAIGWIDARGNKSLVGHWKDLDDWLGPEDTKLGHTSGTDGHQVRFYNKRAVILVGMRATTPNAKAFRKWIADSVLMGMDRPLELLARERETLLAIWTAQIRGLLGMESEVRDEK